MKLQLHYTYKLPGDVEQLSMMVQHLPQPLQHTILPLTEFLRLQN
jgi:hypothetical protein